MNIGLGSALHQLGGGSRKNSSDYYGRTIQSVAIESTCFILEFSDDVVIKIWDDAQTCCESRYMSTDDDPKSLIGKKLLHIVAKEGPEIEGEYGDVHEQVFVEIMTEDGDTVTLVSHNEHNGYYGGFGLSIDEIEAKT
jgi:hypothetical protein